MIILKSYAKINQYHKKSEKKNYNYISKLFFKIFLSSLLLFSLVLIDKNETINIKEKIKSDFNFLKIVSFANKHFGNIIDLNGDINVDSKEYYEVVEYINNKNIVHNYSFDGVVNINNGVITKIEKNNNSYNITIKGEDDFNYVFYGLVNIDYNIYSYVKEGEVIGLAAKNNDYYSFELEIIKDGVYYDYFEIF